MTEPVVQRLIAVLCETGDDRRERVAEILADIGEASIMPLTAIFTHQDKEVRQWAVYSLGHIGEKGNQIPVDLLVTRLKDSDSIVRQTAAVALGRYVGGHRFHGTPVTLPIKPLLVLLKDSNVLVREQAAWALGEIGEPRALPDLERVAKKDKNWLVLPSKAAKVAREAIEKIQKEKKELTRRISENIRHLVSESLKEPSHEYLQKVV